MGEHLPTHTGTSQQSTWEEAQRAVAESCLSFAALGSSDARRHVRRARLNQLPYSPVAQTEGDLQRSVALAVAKTGYYQEGERKRTAQMYDCVRL